MFSTKILRSATAALSTNPHINSRSRTGIQIVSDIHLEYRKENCFPKIPKHAPNLALLGDIGHPYSNRYAQFIEMQSYSFEKVFILMGNHEYWNESGIFSENILHQARHVCSRFSNVVLLERETFDITDDTRILGCTLWSKINKYSSEQLSDFRKIFVPDLSNNPVPLTRRHYLHWHYQDKEWIEKELLKCKEDGKRAIVLSHHGPLLEMSGKYAGSPVNSGFVTDLHYLFNPPAVAFASGHVHSNVDTTVNGIRSVSNAKGYPRECVNYKEDVVIRI